jgi:signal transduction histidine kinase
VLVLREIAEDVVELLADTAKKDKVKLRIDQPQHVRITQTNVTLVQQILLNVVLNAIQQIGERRPKEGGAVRIWFEDVEDQGRPAVCINVEDDGPGIHRRLWERIFELGYTTRKDGSGLGLHISRSLADVLGGRVYVLESYIGWGTTFSIVVPLKL